MATSFTRKGQTVKMKPATGGRIIQKWNAKLGRMVTMVTYDKEATSDAEPPVFEYDKKQGHPLPSDAQLKKLGYQAGDWVYMNTNYWYVTTGGALSPKDFGREIQ